MLSCFVINVDYDNIYIVSSLILWMLIDYFVYRHESVIEELSDVEIVPLEQNEVDVSGWLLRCSGCSRKIKSISIRN